MKKTIAAAAALAMSPALLLSATPAHAVTAQICNGYARACITAPGGSSLQRSGSASVGAETVVVRDGGRRYLGTINAWNNFRLYGSCDASNPNSQTYTVVKATKTRMVAANGMTVFAVGVVQKFNGKYDTRMFLTAEASLRTLGTKKTCQGVLGYVFWAKTGPAVSYQRFDNSPITNYYTAKARFNDSVHVSAFNTMATIYYR